MDKSISFKLTRNDYLKCLLSKFLNKKIFFITYLLFVITQIPLVIKNFSLTYFIANLLTNFIMTAVLFILLFIFMFFYSSYIYKRDPILNSEETMNFHDQFFEEITPFSTYKIKYKEIYYLKLLKSMMLIHLSPARIIIVPKNTSYNIEELYQEIKKIKESK